MAVTKLRYLKRSNISASNRMIREWYHDLVNSYGIDVSYFRLKNNYFTQASGSVNLVYGEDTVAEYYLSGAMTVFMEMHGDSFLLNKFGIETDADASVYFTIDDFTEQFKEQLGVTASFVADDIFVSGNFENETGVLSGEYEYDGITYVTSGEYNISGSAIPSLTKGLYCTDVYTEYQSFYDDLSKYEAAFNGSGVSEEVFCSDLGNGSYALLGGGSYDISSKPSNYGPGGGWCMRMQGMICLTETGIYTFQAGADDFIYTLIDNSCVVYGRFTGNPVTAYFVAGWYPITIYVQDNCASHTNWALAWKRPSQSSFEYVSEDYFGINQTNENNTQYRFTYNSPVNYIPKVINSDIKYQTQYDYQSSVSGDSLGNITGFLVSGDGIITGEVSMSGTYYTNPPAVRGWKIAPQVGDFFRLSEFQDGDNPNYEEYEITRVYDRNLQTDGINPLLGTYIWRCDVVRREPSHETININGVTEPDKENLIQDNTVHNEMQETSSDTVFDYENTASDTVDTENSDNAYGGY